MLVTGLKNGGKASKPLKQEKPQTKKPPLPEKPQTQNKPKTNPKPNQKNAHPQSPSFKRMKQKSQVTEHTYTLFSFLCVLF